MTVGEAIVIEGEAGGSGEVLRYRLKLFYLADVMNLANTGIHRALVNLIDDAPLRWS